MYIGRYVVIGKTLEGAWYLGYRVSSRSFPNRRIVAAGDRAVVLPTDDAPPSDNPYITYNCLRRHGDVTVVANGSHADPVIDKVSLGYPLRDALALSLLAMDYEHDEYSTPRIAGGVDAAGDAAYLAIVGEDRLMVRRVAPPPGDAFLVATYELNYPTPTTLKGETADDLAEALLQSEYEHPVASLAATITADGLHLAARSVR